MKIVRRKKCLAMLIAVTMIVSMLPVSAFAETTENCTDDSCTHVAAIGNTHYDTLKAAFDAATDGQTVTLLQNTSTDQIVIGQNSYLENKNITLDLNGKKITYSPYLSFGTLSAFQIKGGDGLNLIDSVGTGEVDAGANLVFDAQKGTLNISGGTYKSTGTIGQLSGSNPVTVNISGGYFNGNSFIDSNSCYYSGGSSINISGGYYSSQPQFYFNDNDPRIYLADGFKCIDNEDATYKWKVVSNTPAEPEDPTPVAQIGSTQYNSLQAAFAAATGGTADKPVVIEVLVDELTGPANDSAGKVVSDDISKRIVVTTDKEWYKTARTNTEGWPVIPEYVTLKEAEGVECTIKGTLELNGAQHFTVDGFTFDIGEAGYAYRYYNNGDHYVAGDTYADYACIVDNGITGQAGAAYLTVKNCTFTGTPEDYCYAMAVNEQGRSGSHAHSWTISDNTFQFDYTGENNDGIIGPYLYLWYMHGDNSETIIHNNTFTVAEGKNFESAFSGTEHYGKLTFTNNKLIGNYYQGLTIGTGGYTSPNCSTLIIKNNEFSWRNDGYVNASMEQEDWAKFYDICFNQANSGSTLNGIGFYPAGVTVNAANSTEELNPAVALSLMKENTGLVSHAQCYNRSSNKWMLNRANKAVILKEGKSIIGTNDRVNIQSNLTGAVNAANAFSADTIWLNQASSDDFTLPEGVTFFVPTGVNYTGTISVPEGKELLLKTTENGKEYSVGDAATPVPPVAPEIKKEDVKEASSGQIDVPSGVDEGLKDKVVEEVINEISGNTSVSGEGATNIQSTEVENKLKAEIEKTSGVKLVDSTSQLKITVQSVATTTEKTTVAEINATTVTTTKAKYDIKPYVTIETTDGSGQKTTETRAITNDELAAANVSIKFRLAVPASMKSNTVVVKHYPDGTSTPDWAKSYEVTGTDNNRYVELEANSFSTYEIEDLLIQGYVAINENTLTPYATLTNAIENVSDDETITIISDTNYTAAPNIIINNGKTFKIDFNGKKLTLQTGNLGDPVPPYTAITIVSNTDVEIDDANIVVTGDNGSDKTIFDINNGSTLYLKDVTYEGSSNLIANNGGKVTINGGTIGVYSSSAAGLVVKHFAGQTELKGTLTCYSNEHIVQVCPGNTNPDLNAGTVIIYSGDYRFSSSSASLISLNAKANVTINSPTYTYVGNNSRPICLETYGYNSVVNISDLTSTGTYIVYSSDNACLNELKVNISGGKYKYDTGFLCKDEILGVSTTAVKLTGGYFAPSTEGNEALAELNAVCADGYHAKTLASTDTEYANGYKYKIVSDGQDPIDPDPINPDNEEEIEESDPEVDIDLGFGNVRIKTSYKSVVLDDKRIVDKIAEELEEEYISFDLTKAYIADTKSTKDFDGLFFNNDVYKAISAIEKDVEINTRYAKAIVYTDKEIGNNPLSLHLTDVSKEPGLCATAIQKKAMNTEKVFAEVNYSFVSNGKPTDNSAKIYVPVPAEAKVFYLFNESKIGTVPCEVIDGYCVFNRYYDGTYIVCAK